MHRVPGDGGCRFVRSKPEISSAALSSYSGSTRPGAMPRPRRGHPCRDRAALPQRRAAPPSFEALGRNSETAILSREPGFRRHETAIFDREPGFQRLKTALARNFCDVRVRSGTPSELFPVETSIARPDRVISTGRGKLLGGQTV